MIFHYQFTITSGKKFTYHYFTENGFVSFFNLFHFFEMPLVFLSSCEELCETVLGTESLRINHIVSFIKVNCSILKGLPQKPEFPLLFQDDIHLYMQILYH